MSHLVQQEAPGNTIRIMNFRERLEERKRIIESQLKEINEALRLLDENPVFEKIRDAISRTNIGLY